MRERLPSPRLWSGLRGFAPEAIDPEPIDPEPIDPEPTHTAGQPRELRIIAAQAHQTFRALSEPASSHLWRGPEGRRTRSLLSALRLSGAGALGVIQAAPELLPEELEPGRPEYAAALTGLSLGTSAALAQPGESPESQVYLVGGCPACGTNILRVGLQLLQAQHVIELRPDPEQWAALLPCLARHEMWRCLKGSPAPLTSADLLVPASCAGNCAGSQALRGLPLAGWIARSGKVRH